MKYPFRLFQLFLVLLLVLLFTTEATRSVISAPTHQEPSAAPSAPVEASSLLGAQIVFIPTDPLSSFYTYAHDAGMRWAPVYLSWDSIAPTPNPSTWDWTYYDAIFANLHATGVEPIVIISSNPCWASTYACAESAHNNGGEGPIDQPGGLDGFKAFVTALANRYKGLVHYYELYNEPDINNRWGSGALNQNYPPNYSAPGPIAYAKMLRVASRAIRSADPANRVVFGGITWEYWDGIVIGFDYWFLDEVTHYLDSLGLDGYGSFDVMNYHYYDRIGYYRWGNNPVNKAIAFKTAFPRLKDKAFIISELGEPWAQIPPDPSIQPPLSDSSATTSLVRSMTQLMAGPGQGVHFLAGVWFTYDYFKEYAGTLNTGSRGFQSFPIDIPHAPFTGQSLAPATATYRYWGLLNADGSPRYYNPSQPNDMQGEYTTFQTLNTELREAVFEAAVTDNPNVEAYRFVMPDGSTRVVLWSKSGTQTFSFQKNRLEWVDKFGARTSVVDGDPGNDSDARVGWIGLQVSTPIYVELPPITIYLPSICKSCQ